MAAGLSQEDLAGALGVRSPRCRSGPVVQEAIRASPAPGALAGLGKLPLLALDASAHLLGKSTTIRMLLGMVWPSGGWVELFGARVRRSGGQVWSRVGFAQHLGGLSYLLVAMAGLAGLLGTFAWWQAADQT